MPSFVVADDIPGAPTIQTGFVRRRAGTGRVMAAGRYQRMVHNEEVFRRANERLHNDWNRLGIDGTTNALFLCECGDAACREPIRMRMSEYEAVRTDADAFLLLPGHENGAVETVVAEHDGRYTVVRKNGTRPMDDRKQRLARNEAAFRALNERAHDVTEELAFEGVIDMPDVFECHCECADPDCITRVRVRQSEYERVRANPAQFIVAPGHEVPEIERTVFEGEGFAVVEKHPGERAIAQASDPRS